MHTLEQLAVDTLCSELLTKLASSRLLVGRYGVGMPDGIKASEISYQLLDATRLVRELRHANSPAMAAYATAEQTAFKRMRQQRQRQAQKGAALPTPLEEADFKHVR